MTPSIESLGTPLAFKAGEGVDSPAPTPGELRVHSHFRALEGMQKEALIHHAPSSTIWRMVSDEGPYLAGTDLAPFPLAFYTAGIVFSFMSEVLRHARDLGAHVTSLAVTSDHYYTMQGSALRGDMTGGAMPVELAVELESDADAEQVAAILERARTTSPAEAYMREPLRNRFALVANGRPVELESLEPSAPPIEIRPPRFDEVEPLDGGSLDDLITKLAAAEVRHGVAGGAGSSLQPVQKRTLHVRGAARLLSDTLKEIRVDLLQPIGSSFRFLGEDGGRQQAPPALAYLAAGVGFCYMTQLGRYAHITKRKLESYQVVQDNVFRAGAATGDAVEAAGAEPVDTRVYLDVEEPDEVASKIVQMGERTCFLHAAMRETHPTRLARAQAVDEVITQPGEVPDVPSDA